MKVLSLLLHLISLAPSLNYIGAKKRVKFVGSCLKQNKVTFTPRTIVSVYIIYEINFWERGYDDYLALENFLFGAIELVKNADIDNYKYSGYGIGFDRNRISSFPAGGFYKNVITFEVDRSSSVHVDSKKKDILILGDGPTQGLDDTKWTVEKLFSISITESRKKFCLRLHYNGVNNYLFVNDAEIRKFRAKKIEIVATPLCLGNYFKRLFNR